MSDQSYHGYGATDMYAVDEHFGTLEDFKALAAALHKRGMKLVLDTVPNHVGPAHVWVEDSPEPDWFHGTKGNHREAQGDFQTADGSACSVAYAAGCDGGMVCECAAGFEPGECGGGAVSDAECGVVD